MTKRAMLAVRMRVRTVTARTRREMILFVLVACYLLRCGDVEVNPGPVDQQTRTQSVDRDDNERQKEGGQCIEPDVATQILNAIQQQNNRFDALNTNMTTMKEDLCSIKIEIGQVNEKCDKLYRRCNALENITDNMGAQVQTNQADINELFDKQTEMEGKMTEVLGKTQKFHEKLESLEEEIDRQEQFSRRDNVRMFGIPHAGKTSEQENYDSCAKAVIDILNSVEAMKRWTNDDIGRAHRIGKSIDGKPRPMIVKFSRWRDKMSVLSDRQFRDRLEKHTGVRIVNDLTRRQSELVAAARDEGKVAFFKNGKMVVGPRRPDPRSYAEVASSSAPGVTEVTRDATQSQPAVWCGLDPARTEERRAERSTLDSWRDNNCIPARENRSSAQAEERPRQQRLNSQAGVSPAYSKEDSGGVPARGSRTGLGVGAKPKQYGLGRFWSDSQASPSPPSRSTARADQPRRSERNRDSRR